jgi:pilus assembly protein Flp/PilA
MKFIKKMFKNENGATAIEYGLIAALISVAAMAAIGTIGRDLNTTFTQIGNQL